MTTINLSSYSRETLEHLLRMLKSYKNGLRQVGKRISLSDPLNPTPTQAVVEYMSSMAEGDILKYANACLSYAFPEYHGDAPILRKNDTLK